jgi:ketosteroid isomerase-like protein
MRTISTALAVAIPCVLFATAPSRGEEQAPSPKDWLLTWAKALDSGKLTEILPFYADSDDLVVIASSGDQHKGFAAVKKEYDKAFREVVFSDSEVSEVTVKRLDDVVWASYRHRYKLRVLADNTKWQAETRTTVVLKRNKKSWEIVLEHSSPIAGTPRIRPLERPEEKRPKP